MINKKLVIQSIIKAGKGLWNSFPVLIGVILLVSLANSLIQESMYGMLFTGNFISDPIIGGVIGSILAGNPVTSYVLGGELLTQGVSLLAVTAFLVSWVTVGLIQFPAESMLLGRKFAILRNVTAFFFSIIVAILTVGVVSLI